MAIRLRRWTSLPALGLLAASMATACGTVVPLPVQSGDSGTVAGVGQSGSVVARSSATATPAASRTRLGGPQPVAVRRDALMETLSLDGTVVAQSQEPVLYAGRGTVDTVRVKVGQSVTEGEVLVDFDGSEIVRSLDVARVNLQAAEANLAQERLQAAAREAALNQQEATNQQRQQQAILDAQAGLRRAQDNLALVQSGKVAGGRAAGNRPAQQAAVVQKQTELERAQRTLDKLAAGPDADALRSAEREVANDQIAVTRAEADLDALTSGPDPATSRAAQATLQRAQTQLQLAQAAKVDPRAPDPAVARIQLDGAIQDAQLALQNAQYQVAKLKQPPAEIDVQAARQHVQDAQDTLSTAGDKQAALQAGPDQVTLDDAQAAVDNAQTALRAAQAGLAEINSHPTPAELADAQDQLRKAQATLDNARVGTPLATDAGAIDAGLFLKTVVASQQAVATLEQALDATHLKAPFDGTVVVLRAKPGDLITQSKVVLLLAKPGQPIVRVDLDDAQAKQLNAGQQAALQVGTDTSGATSVSATVRSVTPAAPASGAGASANLEVGWADAQIPRFGTPVTAVVTLQQKQDVLVVPRSAVRQAGGRSVVEVQDGSMRRLVSVQVGISTDAGVEILSGVTDGQMVLAS